MAPSPFQSSTTVANTAALPPQRFMNEPGLSPASYGRGSTEVVAIAPPLRLHSSGDKMSGGSALYISGGHSTTAKNPVASRSRHILEKPRPRHLREGHTNNQRPTSVGLKNTTTIETATNTATDRKLSSSSMSASERYREAVVASACAMHAAPATASTATSCTNSGFECSSSFGSITAEESARVRTSAWKGSCCCDCVQLGGGSIHRPAGPPLACDASQEAGGRKGTIRPRHRRGRSTGALIRQGVIVPPRPSSSISSQPHGWEHRTSNTSATSTAFSSTSTYGSSSQAIPVQTVVNNPMGAGRWGAGIRGVAMKKAGAGKQGGRTMPLAAGGRRSGSWGGSSSLDREFHVILKAGVDVYKHCSTHTSGAWGDVVPRRLKGLWSRRCPLADNSKGLVTLFLDKERDNLCWCSPGAAELVPDHRYSLHVHNIVEVSPGNDDRRRCISVRSSNRPHPLLLELDTDELFDVMCKGLVRIVERNHIRTTLVTNQKRTATGPISTAT